MLGSAALEQFGQHGRRAELHAAGVAMPLSDRLAAWSPARH